MRVCLTAVSNTGSDHSLQPRWSKVYLGCCSCLKWIFVHETNHWFQRMKVSPPITPPLMPCASKVYNRGCGARGLTASSTSGQPPATLLCEHALVARELTLLSGRRWSRLKVTTSRPDDMEAACSLTSATYLLFFFFFVIICTWWGEGDRKSWADGEWFAWMWRWTSHGGRVFFDVWRLWEAPLA